MAGNKSSKLECDLTTWATYRPPSSARRLWGADFPPSGGTPFSSGAQREEEHAPAQFKVTRGHGWEPLAPAGVRPPLPLPA